VRWPQSQRTHKGREMSGNGRFPAKKNLVVVHLLSGSTIEQAARQSGVSDRQVHRWLKEGAFQNALRSQERQVIDACSWRLVSMTKKALDALEDVLREPSSRGANVKRLAAVSVLELTLKWRELVDFEERLSRLERQVFIQ